MAEFSYFHAIEGASNSSSDDISGDNDHELSSSDDEPRPSPFQFEPYMSDTGSSSINSDIEDDDRMVSEPSDW